MEAISIPQENFCDLVKKLDELAKKLEKKLNEYPLPERWLDIPEFCDVMGVCTRTCQNYRDKGKIGFSQIDGVIRFKAADVQELLERHYKPAIKKK